MALSSLSEKRLRRDAALGVLANVFRRAIGEYAEVERQAGSGYPR
jgi:hypothetical protein